jgi:hypothetical protein
MVLQDLLGGELIMAEVQVDGVKVGHHWWNRLPDGTEVDLTRDQFGPEEVLVGAVTRHRPPDAPRRCRGQYLLLRHRVLAAVAEEWPADPGIPAPVVVVVLTDADGAVLLEMRGPDAAAEAGQWALPTAPVLGSGPSPDRLAEALVRAWTGSAVDLRPLWFALREDVTGAAPALATHVFGGVLDGPAPAADRPGRFVPVAPPPEGDVGPTAAGVLYRYFSECVPGPARWPLPERRTGA